MLTNIFENWVDNMDEKKFKISMTITAAGVIILEIFQKLVICGII